MNSPKSSIIQLQNTSCCLAIDPFGGAVTAFGLHNSDINPLSFIFSNEQMPSNNRAGANYQGHFACIGRWGAPSNGEILSGLPHHGEPANIQWTIEDEQQQGLVMKVVAQKEGLKVRRIITMDEYSPVYSVRELVTNINPLGRLFNIVQHPTLAAPFLNEATVVDCNGTNGFDQAFYKNISTNQIEWPTARDPLNNSLDLRNPVAAYNAVFSFVVKPADDYGWITAFSPTHQLLIGYIWKRSLYPWIHLWQHYIDDTITYRGIEFGTAGIHQPFSEILDTATTVFGEKTYGYIDAGETINKNHFSFIHSTCNEFTGVENVYFANDQLMIKARNGRSDISIKVNPTISQ